MLRRGVYSLQDQEAAHIVDDTGQSDLHGGSGNSYGSDNEPRLRLLIRKDMFNTQSDTITGCCICRFRFPDQPKLPVDGNLGFVAKEGTGEIRCEDRSVILTLCFGNTSKSSVHDDLYKIALRAHPASFVGSVPPEDPVS
ncbi:hypothetical protein Gbth_022_007 [Gluconobacter thailandicus F149-1 = NBRC 100600]|nr:hypothetical protein Gbth_022_007 [Gluconobacter thailandicus F149-1 = NBRC 100600]GEL88547.1 hypothetical protein GTH01_29050 [Gluconobacter thailandicus F149-1 = NBRC 100600]